MSFKTLFTTVFVFQRRSFAKIRRRKKIRSQIKSFSKITPFTTDRQYLNKAKHFLKTNFHGYSITKWHHFYSNVNGQKKLEFIPDDLYFNYIEPTLNRNDFAPVISDKIAYDNLFDKNHLPACVLKLLNGRFYDAENRNISRDEAFQLLQKTNKKLILKPAELSGGGKNILVEKSEDFVAILKQKTYLADSFILQEFIEQHEVTAAFHPSSVNSCRLMTARVNEKIVLLTAFFRTGANQSIVDNGQAGGVLCSINPAGYLQGLALDKNGNRYTEHPNSKIKFEGVTIPNYEKVKEFCLNSHKKFLRTTFISWDIAIDKNARPVFIEMNPRTQGITNHQILNGPLFGEYTEYFIDFYNSEKRKVRLPRMVF